MKTSLAALIVAVSLLTVPAHAQVRERAITAELDTCRYPSTAPSVLCASINLYAPEGQDIRVRYDAYRRIGTTISVVVPEFEGSAPAGSLQIFPNGGLFMNGAGLSVTFGTPNGPETISTRDEITDGRREVVMAHTVGVNFDGTFPGGLVVSNPRSNPPIAWTGHVDTIVTTLTAPHLAAGPDTIQPGGTLLVAWAAIASPTPLDWFGLYRPNAGEPAFLHWLYVDCTQGGSDPVATGTCDFVIPTSIPAGVYEMRLYSNDGFTRLATSRPFRVTR